MNSTKRGRTLKEKTAEVPNGWPPANLLAQPEMFVRKVVFDLHGPILDWATPFCEVAEGLYGVKLDPAKVSIYNMAYDASFGLSPAQFNNAFVTFARLARGGYGDLPARAGIQETFAKLKAAGIAVEIWTWVPGAAEHNHDTLKPFGTGIAQSGTLELIRSLGLVDDVQRQVRFISPNAKAAEMAEEHIPLIVEDHPVTAVAAGMFGNACILVPETYNEHIVAPGVLRLNRHSELASTIIGFFKAMDTAGALLD